MVREDVVTVDERPRRIAVWGAAASGKTTLGRRLGQALGVPHLELDAVHWGPGWEPISTDAFRARVAVEIARDRWVIDGEYFRKVADLIWERADTVIWLDYPLPVLIWRLLWRTVTRVRRREVLWSGNRETWRGAFLSRDSLFLHLLRTERRRRRQRAACAVELIARGVQVVRLRTLREADAWLARVTANWSSEVDSA